MRGKGYRPRSIYYSLQKQRWLCEESLTTSRIQERKSQSASARPPATPQQARTSVRVLIIGIFMVLLMLICSCVGLPVSKLPTKKLWFKYDKHWERIQLQTCSWTPTKIVGTTFLGRSSGFAFCRWQHGDPANGRHRHPTPSEPAAPAPSPETTAHEKRAKFQGKAYQTGSEIQVLGEDPPARVEKTPKEDDSTALPGKAPAPKEKTLDQEENLTESGSGNEARVLTCHLYSKFHTTCSIYI